MSNANQLLINGKRVTSINENSVIKVIPQMRNFFNGNVTITNGKVVVDGTEYNMGDYGDNQTIKIEVTGSVKSIENTVGDISVTGSVNKVKTSSGCVEITGDVSGDVETMSGNIEIGGSVDGDVKTMSGNIRHK